MTRLQGGQNCKNYADEIWIFLAYIQICFLIPLEFCSLQIYLNKNNLMAKTALKPKPMPILSRFMQSARVIIQAARKLLCQLHNLTHFKIQNSKDKFAHK